MSSMVMQRGSTFLRNAKQKISLMKNGVPGVEFLGSRKSHLRHLQITREKKKDSKNWTAKKKKEKTFILTRAWSHGAGAGLISFLTRILRSPAKMRSSCCKTRIENWQRQRQGFWLTQIRPRIPRRACVTEHGSVSSSFVVSILLLVAV